VDTSTHLDTRHIPGTPVLVVDDHAPGRESLTELLEMRGYRASSAENGVAALALLHAGLSPCAILLDLWMPEMDGLEFLRHRQREELLSTIPVIVISALGDAAKRCAGLGVQAFVTKPLVPSRLYATLADCTRGRRVEIR
jgi:CheY-like chemotaxis protein